MKGESKGADGEVTYALALGKPVFYDIESLYKFYKNENN